MKKGLIKTVLKISTMPQGVVLFSNRFQHQKHSGLVFQQETRLGKSLNSFRAC